MALALALAITPAPEPTPRAPTEAPAPRRGPRADRIGLRVRLALARKALARARKGGHRR